MPRHRLQDENLLNHYTLDKELGRGQYGICYRAIDKKTKEVCAVKSIAKCKLNYREEIEDINREVEILQGLKGHNNVVCYRDVFEDEDDVHIVMELCEGGELFDSIIDKGHYTEKDAAEVIRSMAEVMTYCHSNGVFHRDLKPENFLLKKNDDGRAHIKLTDFGLSVFFKDGDIFDERLGSAYYIAPEILQGRYDYMADMWSVGVIMFLLLTGYAPFNGHDDQAIFDAIQRGHYEDDTEEWRAVSNSAKAVIRKLLTKNPTKRITAKELLMEPWVNGVDAASVNLGNKVITRIKRFSAENKLKKAALYMMGQMLNPSEIVEIRELFTKIDKDGNGSITIDEMRKGLKEHLGRARNEEELLNIMENADVDGDGEIDYNEFIAATININQTDMNERIWKVFQKFDIDQSGYITADEVIHGLKKLGLDLEGVDGIFEVVDKNSDGKIDYTEFRQMMYSGNNDVEGKRRASYISNLYS